MVTVVEEKKTRICMDPQDLNQAIKREHYPLSTVEEMVSRMPNAKYFSFFDANQGVWLIRLVEESPKLCTFNAPMGLYRFLRLPFGFQRGCVCGLCAIPDSRWHLCSVTGVYLTWQVIGQRVFSITGEATSF